MSSKKKDKFKVEFSKKSWDEEKDSLKKMSFEKRSV